MEHVIMLKDAQRAFDEGRLADADNIAREMILDGQRTQCFDLIHEGLRIRARCCLAQGESWEAACFFARAGRYSKEAHFYVLAARAVLKETIVQMERDKGPQALSFYENAIELLTAQDNTAELRNVCRERDSLKAALSLT